MKMTKKQFDEKAIREYEKKNYLPPGWWGIYRRATNGKAIVRFAGYRTGGWIVEAVVRGVVQRRGIKPTRTGAFTFAKKIAP